MWIVELQSQSFSGPNEIVLNVVDANGMNLIPFTGAGPLVVPKSFVYGGGQLPVSAAWVDFEGALQLSLIFGTTIGPDQTFQVLPWGTEARGANGEWFAPEKLMTKA